MSRGPWKRCPKTGLSLARLSRVSEDYLTLEGNFHPGRFSDCDLFDVRSIAAVCGFRDWAYFRDRVLTRSDCPIHIRKVELRDQDTGQLIAKVLGTHHNSAEVGGRMWHAMQCDAARQRLITAQNHGQAFRSHGEAKAASTGSDSRRSGEMHDL